MTSACNPSAQHVNRRRGVFRNSLILGKGLAHFAIRQHIGTMFPNLLEGSIRESQAWSGAGGCEAGSWRWMPAERDEMEPPRTAVETLGGDAAEAPREALDLAVAAGGRLDVHGSAHPLAGGAVDALARMPSTGRPGRSPPPARPRPPVDPTEPQQPCGTAPPSVHRFLKTSPETVPDPLSRSPWPMQVRIQCSTYACEMRTEPTRKIMQMDNKWFPNQFS